MKTYIALFSVVILIAPPVPASGKSIMVGVCGDSNVRISIPVKAPLPGEGPSDWGVVKDYFQVQVGSLLTPPMRRLKIQAQVADVDGP